MIVLYFAWLKEKVGTDEERIPLPEGVATVGDLIEHLKSRSPRHADLFSEENRILTAVNQEMANRETPVSGSDEIAFFPPMTGG